MHATFATSKVAGWGISGSNEAPGDHKDWEWRRIPAHFKSAIHVLNQPSGAGRTRTNENRRHPGRSAERHVGHASERRGEGTVLSLWPPRNLRVTVHRTCSMTLMECTELP